MITDKKIRVILSDKAQEVYEYLNTKENLSKPEQSILNAFRKKKEIIKKNPFYGDSINKKLIPKEYKDKYELNNLFRIELPNFWRVLYTLSNNNSEIEVIAFVLDICNHDKYNKLFGYKKK